jgi:hypothetical protein
MITLQITDSVSTIQKNVSEAIAQVINDKIAKSQNKIVADCTRLASSWILSQPEINSLSSLSPESLAGQLGIPQAFVGNVVNSIENAVVNSINAKFIKYSKNLKGGLEIYFQPNDFINLLSLPAGHVVYRGGDLHWLDWLLKRGDNVIVANYQYNPQTGLGRSGLGNMILGGSFRIPPQFSGTDNNNFITRALIGPDQEAQISDIIQRALA